MIVIPKYCLITSRCDIGRVSPEVVHIEVTFVPMNTSQVITATWLMTVQHRCRAGSAMCCMHCVSICRMQYTLQQVH